MDDQPRRVLRQLMDQYGPDLLEDPRRLEGLLADSCGAQQREIFVLIHALRMGAPQALQRTRDGQSLPVLQQRLAQRLQDRYAFTQEAANWAVQSWTEALVPAPRPSRVRRLLRGVFHLAASGLRGAFAGLLSKPGKAGGDRLGRSGVQWFKRKGFSRAQVGGLAAIVLAVAVTALLATQWERVVAVVQEGNPLALLGEGAPGADAGWTPPSLEEAGARLRAQHPPPQQAQIAAALLNVRAEPGLEAEVVGRVGPQGAQVTLLDYSQDGRWARLDAPVVGWISTEYVVLLPVSGNDPPLFLRPGVARVVQPGLVLRDRPSPEASQRGVLAAGQLVLQLAVTTDGAWTQLASPNEGWVRSSGLQAAGQE